MIRVLYPGSFDPITKGHMNIINQACDMFDEVVVAILVNPGKKNYMFNIDEREEIIKELYKNNPKVKVVKGNVAAVDTALNEDCVAIVRGLRGLSDYDFEVQLAKVNRDISDGKINTVCLFADEEYQFISSSMVKEVFKINKDISKYVDKSVHEKMKMLRK